MKTIVISSSLNPKSRSAILAAEARSQFEAVGQETDWLDLREHPLPHCDAGSAYGDGNVQEATTRITDADAILVATAIYNFDVNSALKNLLELTGRGWNHKVVGFLCAAGGQGSYMSVMPFANSLMLDYRAVVIPRFVYATGAAFNADNALVDTAIKARIQELTASAIEFAQALEPYIRSGADE